MASVNQVLQAAVKHHQQGQRERAEALYREILRVNPQHPDALHLLGVIGNESGDQQMAVDYIQQAISLRPDIAEFHNNLGNALQAQRKLSAAEASYRRAIELKPDYATAHNNLGNALKSLCRLDEAVACYRTALELQPSYAGALCNLASAHLDLRKPDEAVALIRQALTLQPHFPEAYNNLGNALQAQGKEAEAEAAYRQALRLNPNYSAAYNNLGALLQSMERWDEALECFQRSLQIQPDYADAHGNLGNVLINLGKREQAIESFRRALEYNHNLAGPYHELAQLACRGATEFSESEVAQLRRLIETPPASQDQASLLNFAFARLLEQDGEYDQAFPHYQQGNVLRQQYLKQQNIQVDHEKYLEMIDVMVSVFDRDYFERVAAYGLSTQVPVFIVGMPRSGTTLIEQILASHPQVYGAGELKQVAALASRLKKEIDEPDGYPACLRGIGAETVQSLASGHLEFLQQRGGPAARIVDKMPLNYNHLGLIATLFPQARVIHCRRDPIDTCFSCFVQYAIPTSLPEIGRCYRQYERLMDHWREVLPIAMHEVEYEQMVMDQEQQTRSLVAYCGLDWDDRCLRFYETDRSVQTPSKLDVRRPIYGSAIGGWKKYEAHMGPLLEALGISAQTAGIETAR